MKKITLLLCILLVMTGCTRPVSSDSPEKKIKDGLKNLVGISSYNFDLSLDGAFDALKEDEIVKFAVDGQLLGQVDAKNSEDPKFLMSLSGSGSVDSGDPQNLAGELRMNKENLFFKISSLPALSGQGMPPQLADQFTGKWWQIPIPEGTYTKDNPLFEFSEANSEEAEQYRKLLDKYDLFTDLADEGLEVVRGEESHKYSARLDKDGAKNFLVETRKLSNMPPTDEEISELEKMFNSMTFTGYIYVGTKSEKVNRLSGELYIRDVSGEKVKEGNFDLAFTMWDFGKSVDLQLPEEAELFNPFMLLGGVPEPPAESSESLSPAE